MQHLSLLLPPDWKEYELIDSGNGEKLERFGPYTLRRPDPQIIWSPSASTDVWNQADAVFQRTHSDKGIWKFRQRVPESWLMGWNDVQATVKLSPFKHTGVFPEQAAHWSWIRDELAQSMQRRPNYQPTVLNLFAYTGMASVVCAKLGAKVTHVDASRSAIGWAKNNQQASGLDERSIRWILDDVLKFVGREVRRGARYDGIIMDPPIYGHGPTGEVWDFPISFPVLMEHVQHILTDEPLFVVVNAYAISSSALTLGNVLEQTMGGHQGTIETGELVLQESRGKRLLSTGIFARWRGN